MDRQTMRDILDALNSLGMESKPFFSALHEALDQKPFPDETARQVLDGFELCVHFAPDGNSDPDLVWRWFSQEHVPALGATLLQTCLTDGTKTVSDYLDHLRAGGYS